jgi:CRP/FNR family transcriptional regulator, cyclic AMP receptor protein
MGRNDYRTAVTHELLQIPSFRGCSSKQLAQIDRLTDISEVPAGRVLVREGAISRELYVIVSGTATVTQGGRLLNTLGSGELFGELGAIDIGRRDATLTAISHLRVLTIGPREFGTLVADVPSFRDMLLRGMAKRLRAADETIASMTVISKECPVAEVRSLALQH